MRLKNPPALLEVRGEAYIGTKEFEALNTKLEAAGEKPFPNARNATAGTLKQLDPRLVAQRPISAVFYAVGACEGIEFETHAKCSGSARELRPADAKTLVALHRHGGSYRALSQRKSSATTTRTAIYDASCLTKLMAS